MSNFASLRMTVNPKLPRHRRRYRRHLHRHRPARRFQRPDLARQDAERAERSLAGLPDRHPPRARRGRPGRAVARQRVLHGTTVATNMILEGKGAEAGAGHHGGLPPRADHRPPGHPAPRQLPRLGEAGAAGPGGARVRGQGADRRRRRGDRAARRGERRGRRRSLPQARRRGGRGLPAAFLRQPGARAQGRRHPAGQAARRARSPPRPTCCRWCASTSARSPRCSTPW